MSIAIGRHMDMELPRIVVGVDFSRSSQRAIDEAQQLAAQMGAQIDVVHVCPTPSADANSVERARQALAAVERQLRDQGFAAKTHLAVGEPVVGLLDYVRRLQPVLVVVGSHGHGAVMRLVMGSVAESLIRRAGVPVMVVPAAERIAQGADAGVPVPS